MANWEIDLGMDVIMLPPKSGGLQTGGKDEKTTDVNNGRTFLKEMYSIDDTPLIQLIVCCSNWRSFMSSY